ncbi:MAG: biopolymer transporter ExbD [Planctomycetota bacterium]|nr:biopolymer transporter ExbD [Planctomycetota bacterium]
MSDSSTENPRDFDDDRPGDDPVADITPVEDDDFDFDDDDPVLPRKPMQDTADMDITPMIDIVFLLLIFFLVSSTPDKNTAVELPPARYGVGVSEKNSVVITLAPAEGAGKTSVYIADGRKGSPLPENKAEKTAAIVAAVEEGFFRQSKSQVLIKAGGKVKRKEVYAVEIAVSKADVEGLKIYHGVYEKN